MQVLLWLVPVAIIAVAGAVVSAWRGRPPRKPTMDESIRAHRETVAALASTWQPQRGAAGESADEGSRTVRPLP